MKNDTMITFSEESRQALIKAIATKAVESLITSTKDATDQDSGTFNVICSTEDRDRQNEIVKQDGWDLSFYKLNPVVLWAHDYSSLPVGVCTSIAVIDGKLQAEGRFAPAAANPYAQQVRMLYDLGFVKTVSVGFIPKEYDPNDRDVVLKAELLEFSFVPVPANAYALSQNQIKELGIDMELLKTKGLNMSVKAPSAGDRCNLDDGTIGILGIDPNNADGPMVCIPSKSMTHKDAVEKAIGNLNKSVETFKAAHVKAHADHSDNHTKAIEALKDVVKDADVSKTAEAFANHSKAVSDENQRHAKEVSDNQEPVGQSIEALKDCVTAAMKDYPDDCNTGDDTGMNPTADEVRMVKTIKEAFDHIDKAHTALKGYAESEGGKKAGDDPAAPAPKVETSPADQKLIDVNSFIRNRELVKALSIVLGKVLREHNLGAIV